MSISHLVWPCREVRSVARRAVAVLTVLFTAALGLAVSATGVSAEPAAVGYRDFSYAADGVDAPTGEKPQSKLWFAGGSWWGALFSTATDSYNIYRLNRSTQTWVDTGVQLDDRNSARLDVLWDGSRLYVAGAGRSQSASSDRVEVSRYSYDSTSGSYSRDAGFPVTVASGGTEAVVIDKDSTGELWVTYTRDNRVYVAHSTTSDASWTTPFVIPVSGADTLTSDDISSVVAYDGNIGVMWSNQNDSTMYFAFHQDGAADTAWTVNPAVQSPGYADDHMNLKSLQADAEGRVYAITKTSLSGTGSPLILLLVLDKQGSWKRHTFARHEDRLTRPIILIDDEAKKLYGFAAGPDAGGIVYYKETPLDNIGFATGKGEPFIEGIEDSNVNNPSSTKQTINSTTGVVVIAADDVTDYYLHNDMSATPPGQTFDTVADARVEESSPFQNLGASYLFADAGSGVNVESNLRFDVSGLSGQVQKATLRVYASSDTVDGPAVYQTSGAWTESELTWSNRPARSGVAIDELGSIAAGSWAEYDVTAAVSGDGTYDFVLVTDSTDGVRFRSREETPTPQLVITTGNDDVTPPAAPDSLAATAVSSSSIDLAWTDNADDETSLDIERSLDGSTFEPLASAGADVTTYSDTGLAAATTYWYRVRAVNAAGASAWSNVASATTSSDTGQGAVEVGSIVVSTVNTGKGFKAGQAAVTVVDQLGAPVEGAVVTGDFTGTFNELGATSEPTTADGTTVLITSGTAKGNVSVTFCATSIIHPELNDWSGSVCASL